MTTQAGIEGKERDLVLQCVGEAYEVLHLMPGVDANGPVLVWLAEQFMQIRRGDERSSPEHPPTQ
jgi:hypothetical protein